MKQRVISGAIIALLTLIIVAFGGFLFNLFTFFIIAWGSYEFCSSRNRKINWVECGLMFLFSLLLCLFYNKSVGLILALLVSLITLSVFNEDIPFNEVSVTFIESIILGYACHFMLDIEFTSKLYFGYIVIIAYLTDACALFSGMLFGKHKLNERISPKKTVEGAIGGWLIGAIISFVYASICSFFNQDMLFILSCSLVLPIISQIGDLAFSLIKRHYGIKDYSKLIPGHGGLLDRLDSLMFVLLIYGALAVLFGI